MSAERKTASPVQVVGAVAGVVLPFLLLTLPVTDLPPAARRALAITLFTVIFWITSPMAVEYTGLVSLFLLVATSTTPFEVAFSAFTSKSLWLIISGLILSLGISECLLGRRLALSLLRWAGRWAVNTYSSLIITLMLLAFALSFFIPGALVRILILLPVVIEICGALGVETTSRPGAGIILATCAATYYPALAVLTGALPNIIVHGMIERYTGYTVGWGEWLVRFLPVTSVLQLLIIFILIHALFRIRIGQTLQGERIRSAFSALGPMSLPEKKVAAILGLTVTLWASDFLHHLHPTVVALLAVVLYFLPGVGAFRFDLIRKLNVAVWFFFGAVFGLAAALQESGFNTWMGKHLFLLIPLKETGWFFSHYLAIWIGLLFNLLMETAASSSVLTPIFLTYAQQHLLNPLPLVLALAMAYQLPYLPYQAVPWVVLLGLGHLHPRQIILFMGLITLASLLIVAPLTLLYWSLMGWL